MTGNRESVAAILFGQITMLKAEVDRVEPEAADRRGSPGSGISAFIQPFNSFLARAKEVLADDLTALRAIGEVEPVEDVREGHLSARYHKEAKYKILLGCGIMLAALQPRLAGRVELPAMKVGREGIFFAGQYHDALQRASEIFASAKRTIVLIDGYIGREILELLAVKSPAVGVRILTKELPPGFLPIAEAFNKQHGRLEVRLSDTFHDRFVVIDGAEVYHFGASIKDLGKRGFMFSRVEEPTVIDLLKDRFETEWKKARVGVAP